MTHTHRLIPMNKYVVLETLEETMIGGLYVPHNATSQYGQAIVVDYADCEEATAVLLKEGDVVLYDKVGSVEHKIGKRKLTTVKIMNIIGIVRENK